MSDEVYLIYIGTGFIPDVPARDLTKAEVELYGGEKFLLESGQYARPAKEKPHAGANKMASGGEENK